jgi:glycosyltransferase involved in cell wall biosynthesis
MHLVGAQSPDQLVDWYNAAELFCSATTREGSPNVLFEAMACGLPCVTTPVGGNREAVTSQDVGILAPSDAESLGRALAAALTRTWNRARIAEHAGQRTWAVVAGECREHLRQMQLRAS